MSAARFMWDAEQPSAREILYLLHGLESVQQAGEERLGVPQLVSEALSEKSGYTGSGYVTRFVHSIHISWSPFPLFVLH